MNNIEGVILVCLVAERPCCIFFWAVSANGNTSGLQPEIKSSILLRSTSFIGTLCNGSTTDFDSVSLGSIPSVPAMQL